MNSADKLFAGIFRRGSRTYFTSSLLFPAAARRDIFCLYAFVRTADDFVDRLPQDARGFEEFRRAFESCRDGSKPSGGPIVDRFLELACRRSFDPRWADAFLDSMSMDLWKRTYPDFRETLGYMYGSAEVIGLMMSSILGLSPDLYRFARLQGRAMQYINFIRDIRQDNLLGRTYFPSSELERFGLASLAEEESRLKPGAFLSFIRAQVARYRIWQKAAAAGYAGIPRRSLVPLRTAADMYGWTAGRIAADPWIVYRTTLKPGRGRIIGRGLWNAATLRRG